MFYVANEINVIIRNKGFKTLRKAAKWARKNTDQEVRILDSENGMDYTDIPEEELLSRTELIERFKNAREAVVKERQASTEAAKRAADDKRKEQLRLIDAGLVPIEVITQYLGDVQVRVEMDDAPLYGHAVQMHRTFLQMDFHPRNLTVVQPGRERPDDEEPFSRLVAKLRGQ